MLSEKGGWGSGGGVDVRIKGYALWMGSVFFKQKFFVLAVGPSRGTAGLGVGL